MVFLNYTNIHNYARKLMGRGSMFVRQMIVMFLHQLSLSGGNQQKAIIVTSEVDRDPDLLIVSQPTRGLERWCGFEYIHKRLIGERDKGKEVLVVSFELMDEILNLS